MHPIGGRVLGDTCAAMAGRMEGPGLLLALLFMLRLGSAMLRCAALCCAMPSCGMACYPSISRCSCALFCGVLRCHFCQACCKGLAATALHTSLVSTVQELYQLQCCCLFVVSTTATCLLCGNSSVYTQYFGSSPCFFHSCCAANETSCSA